MGWGWLLPGVLARALALLGTWQTPHRLRLGAGRRLSLQPSRRLSLQPSCATAPTPLCPQLERIAQTEPVEVELPGVLRRLLAGIPLAVRSLGRYRCGEGLGHV